MKNIIIIFFLLNTTTIVCQNNQLTHYWNQKTPLTPWRKPLPATSKIKISELEHSSIYGAAALYLNNNQ